MRSLLPLLLLAAVPLWAEPATVRLQLPPDVEFKGSRNTAAGTEILLGRSAFLATVKAAAPLSVGEKDGLCVILVPASQPALSLFAVAGGPVTVEWVSGPEAAAAPVQPASPKPAGPPPAPKPPGAKAPTPPANAKAEAPEPEANPMEDLLGKALGGALKLPQAVKFDPVAMADYAIPASGAATVIGTSTALTRPGAPREVVTSLLSHFDEEGRLQTGFSIALTPYTLLRKMPLTSREYAEEPSKRFLANLQLSLAARTDESIVTGNDKAVRLGAGLTMVLFDKGDLRLDGDFLTKLTTTLATGVGFSAANVNGTAAIAPTPEQNFTAAAKFWKEEQARRWNAASAGLGVAPAFLSLTGKLADARDDGVMTWVNVALPGPGSLAESTQFILGGNGRFGQRVQVESVWTRADVIDLGAQLRYGSQLGNFFAEAQYRQRQGGAAESEKFVYELGFERRITDGVWLNVSWTNDDAIEGGELIRTGLRYGFGRKAVLSPLQ